MDRLAATAARHGVGRDLGGVAVLPPRPLSEWSTASREPLRLELTQDRKRLVCLAQRDQYYNAGHTPSYGPLRVWDLATGQERLKIPAHTRTGFQPLPGMNTTPDGACLLTSDVGALHLWDIDAGRERWSAPANIPLGQSLPPQYMMSPDGQFVALRRPGASLATDLRLTSTGDIRLTAEESWPLTFSANGTMFVTASTKDFRVRPTVVTVWDTASGRPRRQLQTNTFPGAGAISSDERWLALGLPASFVAAPSSATIEFWDLREGTRAATLKCTAPLNDFFAPMEFSPDGIVLVLNTYRECQRRYWDMRQSPPRPIDAHGQVTPGDTSIWAPVYPIFSPDGHRAVGPGPDPESLAFRETAAPDRLALGGAAVRPIGWPRFSPNSWSLAVVQPTVYLGRWKEVRNWVNRQLGRPVFFPPEPRCELLVFDTQTGAVTGRLPDVGAAGFGNGTGTRLLGFAADGGSVWTMTYMFERVPFMQEPRQADGTWYYPDGTLVVRQWALTPWPPPWLLAVTATALLLLIADWRFTRRPSAPKGRHNIAQGVSPG